MLLRVGFYLTGGFLTIVSLVALTRLLPDYAILTPYNRGRVWGHLILLLGGSVLLYLGYRRGKRA